MSRSIYYAHDVDKKKYCFVSDGFPCLPPSVNFPPTPVEEYTLKLSDQFSTRVTFYSASGLIGDLKFIYCYTLVQFCGFILLRRVLLY